MPLHLIKLAVGCESVKELKSWVAQRMQTAKQKGLPRQIDCLPARHKYSPAPSQLGPLGRFKPKKT